MRNLSLQCDFGLSTKFLIRRGLRVSAVSLFSVAVSFVIIELEEGEREKGERGIVTFSHEET